MIDRYHHWQCVYETKTETEVSWYQRHPVSSLTLLDRCNMDRNHPIIDIGGGASTLVDHLLGLGYSQVNVLDIAEAALAKARLRLGDQAAAITWIAADVMTWVPSPLFAIWHDRAVFHFLTDAADRAAYLATAASAVRPGGQAIVATFAIDGPERCSGLPVVRYDAEGLAAEFATAFRLMDSLTEDHTTPAGKVQKFQYCRLERM